MKASSKLLRAVSALAAMAFTLTSASAAVYISTNATDTYVQQGDGQAATNFGGAANLAVYPTGNNVLATFISFDDLSFIPNGETITQARLGLYINTLTNFGVGGALQLRARNPGVAWDEMTLTWNNAPQSVLSINDYTGIISSPVTMGTADVGTWVWFDVTGIVPTWKATPATNYGLAIVPVNIGNPTYAVFDSSESSNTAFRPQLEVTTVPEPSTITMLLVGAGGLVAWRLRRRSA